MMTKTKTAGRGSQRSDGLMPMREPAPISDERPLTCISCEAMKKTCEEQATGMKNLGWGKKLDKENQELKAKINELKAENKYLRERNNEVESKIKTLCQGELLPEHWKQQGREEEREEWIEWSEE
jgi:predicted RNase H-like nuclease (RuvC/YqgF family)